MVVPPSPEVSYGDRPVASLERDAFGRGPLVAALRQVLLAPSSGGGLVIGLFGEAGSGRTSVLQMLRGQIGDQTPTVWIDAWQHAHPRGPLWCKLLFMLVDALGDDTAGLPAVADTEFRKAMVRRELAELASCLWRAQRGFQPQADSADAPREGIRRSAGRDADTAGQQQRFQDAILALAAFRWRLTNLIAHEMEGIAEGLTVFVDHLDRCAPVEATQALEMMRSCLDVPATYLVVALGPSPAEALGAGAGAPALIDKVVELGVRLPPPSRQQIEDFAAATAATLGLDGDALRGIVAAGAPANPRRVRRLLTGLALLQQLDAGERLPHLAKLMTLRAGFAKEFRALQAAVGQLKELERAARHRAPGDPQPATPTDRRLQELLVVDPPFATLSDDELGELLRMIEVVV